MPKHFRLITFLILTTLLTLAACTTTPKTSEYTPPPSPTPSSEISLATLPVYDGEASIPINGNIPNFSNTDLALPAGYEYYSPLDELGRCGVCYANIGVETMPTEERGDIGMVKPSGWHTVRYNGLVEGNYLYNRCHLLGYQLSGENANEQNLITGTRYLNVQGMLPYENQVADYVEETGNHVIYRVTPVFDGSDLVADGVLMEAQSVEDNGCQFCVYCYNVQPGVVIDYATGESWLDGETPLPEVDDAKVNTYIINTNSGKFHDPDCFSVADISADNRQEVRESREKLVSAGYEPCGRCKP